MSEEIIIPTRKTIQNLLTADLEARLQVAMSEQVPVSPYVFTKFLNDHAGELAYIGEQCTIMLIDNVAARLGLVPDIDGWKRL